jgi:hypothetical protein
VATRRLSLGESSSWDVHIPLQDDPTIVRHTHDLAALEATISGDARSGAVELVTLIADGHRGDGAVADLRRGNGSPWEWVKAKQWALANREPGSHATRAKECSRHIDIR